MVWNNRWINDGTTIKGVAVVARRIDAYVKPVLEALGLSLGDAQGSVGFGYIPANKEIPRTFQDAIAAAGRNYSPEPRVAVMPGGTNRFVQGVAGIGGFNQTRTTNDWFTRNVLEPDNFNLNKTTKPRLADTVEPIILLNREGGKGNLILPNAVGDLTERNLGFLDADNSGVLLEQLKSVAGTPHGQRVDFNPGSFVRNYNDDGSLVLDIPQVAQFLQQSLIDQGKSGKGYDDPEGMWAIARQLKLLGEAQAAQGSTYNRKKGGRVVTGLSLPVDTTSGQVLVKDKYDSRTGKWSFAPLAQSQQDSSPVFFKTIPSTDRQPKAIRTVTNVGNSGLKQAAIDDTAERELLSQEQYSPVPVNDLLVRNPEALAQKTSDLTRAEQSRSNFTAGTATMTGEDALPFLNAIRSNLGQGVYDRANTIAPVVSRTDAFDEVAPSIAIGEDKVPVQFVRQKLPGGKRTQAVALTKMGNDVRPSNFKFGIRGNQPYLQLGSRTIPLNDNDLSQLNYALSLGTVADENEQVNQLLPSLVKVAAQQVKGNEPSVTINTLLKHNKEDNFNFIEDELLGKALNYGDISVAAKPSAITEAERFNLARRQANPTIAAALNQKPLTDGRSIVLSPEVWQEGIDDKQLLAHLSNSNLAADKRLVLPETVIVPKEKGDYKVLDALKERLGNEYFAFNDDDGRLLFHYFGAKPQRIRQAPEWGVASPIDDSQRAGGVVYSALNPNFTNSGDVMINRKELTTPEQFASEVNRTSKLDGGWARQDRGLSLYSNPMEYSVFDDGKQVYYGRGVYSPDEASIGNPGEAYSPWDKNIAEMLQAARIQAAFFPEEFEGQPELLNILDRFATNDVVNINPIEQDVVMRFIADQGIGVNPGNYGQQGQLSYVDTRLGAPLQLVQQGITLEDLVDTVDQSYQNLRIQQADGTIAPIDELYARAMEGSQSAGPLALRDVLTNTNIQNADVLAERINQAAGVDYVTNPNSLLGNVGPIRTVNRGGGNVRSLAGVDSSGPVIPPATGAVKIAESENLIFPGQIISAEQINTRRPLSEVIVTSEPNDVYGEQLSDAIRVADTVEPRLMPQLPSSLGEDTTINAVTKANYYEQEAIKASQLGDTKKAYELANVALAWKKEAARATNQNINAVPEIQLQFPDRGRFSDAVLPLSRRQQQLAAMGSVPESRVRPVNRGTPSNRATTPNLGQAVADDTRMLYETAVSLIRNNELDPEEAPLYKRYARAYQNSANPSSDPSVLGLQQAIFDLEVAKDQAFYAGSSVADQVDDAVVYRQWLVNNASGDDRTAYEAALARGSNVNPVKLVPRQEMSDILSTQAVRTLDDGTMIAVDPGSYADVNGTFGVDPATERNTYVEPVNQADLDLYAEITGQSITPDDYRNLQAGQLWDQIMQTSTTKEEARTKLIAAGLLSEYDDVIPDPLNRNTRPEVANNSIRPGFVQLQQEVEANRPSSNVNPTLGNPYIVQPRADERPLNAIRNFVNNNPVVTGLGIGTAGIGTGIVTLDMIQNARTAAEQQYLYQQYLAQQQYLYEQQQMMANQQPTQSTNQGYAPVMAVR